MATTPFEAFLPGSSFFDIYNDGAAAKNTFNLPGGACNFVDLTPGGNGSKCGCRRFWSRPPAATPRIYADNSTPDQAVWCMCAHHACYHDDVRGGEAPNAADGVPGQENDKPPATREPLSPIQDLSFPVPAGVPPSLEVPNPGTSFSFTIHRPEEVAKSIQPDNVSQVPDPSLPDTLSWGDFIQSPPPKVTLPPIPSQCIMPSQPSSTTSSHQVRYLRPFAGRGLQTLSAPSTIKSRSPLQEKHPDKEPAAAPHEPSSALVLHRDNAQDTPQRARSPKPDDRLALAPTAGESRENLQQLSETVSGHEQRLDRLENVSFSVAGHEECGDKHDQMDLRVTDLECRLDEVERGMNDVSSHATSRRLINFDESTCSVASVATNATARGSTTSAIYSQIQSLEERLDRMQSFLPSLQHPWEIEVVFLPFPVKRLWQELHEFRAESMQNVDEWTQLPNTNSSSTLREQSPAHGNWAGPENEYGWLLPRACASDSVMDRRLRSRGLVRTISVKGADARSVQVAVNAVFGSLLLEMTTAASPGPRRRSADVRVARYLGLQQQWVPLRKIHKDSRLRFLTPDEMITPALWNKTFLDSVIMRAAEPRLFITQPEAYLQDHHAYDSGWTWQKIRELSRVYPDSQSTQEVPEADALEEYWAFNEVLDDPPSIPSSQTSVSIRQARQRVSVSRSPQQFFTGLDTFRSASPVVAQPWSPIQERRSSSSRPLHIRTASMPPTAPGPFSPAQHRRRVVSGGQQRRSRAGTPQTRVSASIIARRHRTRSPSHPRNTPRWTTSPSPLPPGALAEVRQGPVRGTTPFCYATPYSNGPPMEPRVQQDAGDDDDRGSTTNPDDDDESVGSVEMVTHHAQLQAPRRESQPWQLPEDEPWPGIEDQDRMSDGENIDPLFSVAVGDEQHSDISSQPSEYPSTQNAWHLPGAENGAGFRIHEDEEGMRNWA